MGAGILTKKGQFIIMYNINRESFITAITNHLYIFKEGHNLIYLMHSILCTVPVLASGQDLNHLCVAMCILWALMFL